MRHGQQIEYDQPDGELAGNGRRNDGLRASALDDVHGERGHAHAAHDYGRLIVRDGNWGAHSVLDVLDRVVELLVDLTGREVRT